MTYPLGLALIKMANLREIGRQSNSPTVRYACQRAAFEYAREAQIEWKKITLGVQK